MKKDWIKTLEIEQEKLDKDFQRSLFQIDDLPGESYSLADAIKGYVDQKFELIIKILQDKD